MEGGEHSLRAPAAAQRPQGHTGATPLEGSLPFALGPGRLPSLGWLTRVQSSPGSAFALILGLVS